MAKIILTEEARIADRIIKSLPRNIDVAAVNGYTPQKQIYRTKEVYPKMLVECIHILDMAGFEIREKEI